MSRQPDRGIAATQREAVASNRSDVVAGNELPFRPVLRPPTARLCILDDGETDGEWIRIRHDRLTIGRTEGDVVISHDPAVSGKHLEIVRRVVDGRFAWFLRDLGSANGSFQRVRSGEIHNGQELIIGSRRYAYRATVQRNALLHSGLTAEGGQPVQTQKFAAVSAADTVGSSACLIEITHAGEGKSMTLSDGEDWIGTSAERCSVVVFNDKMCSPVHARIWLDDRGRRQIEDNETTNGVWRRFAGELEVFGETQFQLGEQRFLLRVV